MFLYVSSDVLQVSLKISDVVVCLIDIDFSLLQLDTEWLQYGQAFHRGHLGDDECKV